MVRWLELPKALWELVFGRLDLLDCLRFAAVCKLFQSMIVQKQVHRIFSPLLMLPGKENSKVREFYDFSERKTYPIPLPQLLGRWCCGSSHGWLFIVDYASGEINLLNPISRDQIPLPPLSTFTYPPGLSEERGDRNVKCIERATVSENPSVSNDFVVIVIYTDCRAFAFCKPGDKSWNNLTRQVDNCEDVIYHKGNFYAITNWGALNVWDRCHVNVAAETMISAPEGEACLRRYLVESTDGALLKVCRYAECVFFDDDDGDGDDDHDDDGHSHTLRFEIFKLDVKEKTWIAVKSLGDKAIFVGYNRSICLSTAKNPEFRANCIYFTDDRLEGYFEKPDGCYDMGIFSLENGKTEQIFPDQAFWSTPCIWITPTFP